MAVSTENPGPSRSRNALGIVKFCWADRRVRISTGAVLLLIAAAWYWFVADSATLTIAGRHSFRQAEISIWIDGDLKSTFKVSGSPKKRMGVLQKIDGSFSRSLRVGAGQHLVRVRVHSLNDATDIVRQCQATIESGTESTVFVNADRGILSLGFASAVPKPKPESESSSSYMKLMQSVLMAVAGSALSATVGFLVQDFLRSRKPAAASPTQASSIQQPVQ
jgi:hypothetical protein